MPRATRSELHLSLHPKLLERDPERVSRMFAEISPRYDLLNRVLSFGRDGAWRRTAVRMAAPASAKHLLDLAAGTGDLAFEFLAQRDFHGDVVGLDLSEEMLAVARRKAEARGLGGRVRFDVGDALHLPLPDRSVDIVSVGFGVRNFADLGQGLREAHRVLVPGGRLAVVEFFRKTESAPVRFYLDQILPRVGSWISHNRTAYTYLRETGKGFLSPDEFVETVSAVGFSPVVLRALTFGIAHVVVATKTA